MEEGEARELLEECLRVLFYRDCRALNKIQIAKATAEGTFVSKSIVLSRENKLMLVIYSCQWLFLQARRTRLQRAGNPRRLQRSRVGLMVMGDGRNLAPPTEQ